MSHLVLRAFLVLGLAQPLLGAQSLTGPATPVPQGSGVRPALHPRLFVVNDNTTCRFSSTIQPAVDAAGEGDIVWVKPGTYPGFVIDGKSVTVFAEYRPSRRDVVINGSVEVKNLGADQNVLLRGLLTNSLTHFTASFHDNAGPVWMERCGPFDLSVRDATVGLFSSRVERAQVRGAATAFAYRSDLTGAYGASGAADCSDYCYYDTYLSECSYEVDADPGGPGLILDSASDVFLFGSEVRGGDGGDGMSANFLCCSSCYGSPGWGGDALVLPVGAEAVLMSTFLVPGQGGTVIGGSGGASDGNTVVGGGTVTTLSGQVGGYEVFSPIDSGSSAQVKFTGPPGWNALVSYSDEFDPAYVPERYGYSVLGPAAPTIFVGTLPLSGTLSVSMPFRLPLGARAAVLYMQAKLYDTSTGTAYLAEPSALLVVNDPCL